MQETAYISINILLFVSNKHSFVYLNFEGKATERQSAIHTSRQEQILAVGLRSKKHSGSISQPSDPAPEKTRCHGENTPRIYKYRFPSFLENVSCFAEEFLDPGRTERRRGGGKLFRF